MSSQNDRLRTEPSIWNRRSAHNMRNSVERMLDYTEHLEPGERALVESIFRRGMGLWEIARLMNVQPRTISRRLDRILGRIADPLFMYVLRNVDHWSPQRQEIARAAFLRGRSQRTIAASLDISIHRVRIEIEHIRAGAEPAGARFHSRADLEHEDVSLRVPNPNGGSSYPRANVIPRLATAHVG
jgi:DNA-directed RNA polymerase specialized sigma24 family protein